MALVSCGYTIDDHGRYVQYSIDTDDLDDAEYHYYCKAKDLSKNSSKAREIARKILTGKLTAREIESSAEYSWLTDDLSCLIAELKDKC